MTFAPARLLEVRRYLKPLTGLSDVELGISGDAAHVGGYHHGWDQRRIVNGKLADYSWLESPRDVANKSNAARGFDLGQFARLREFSVWLAAECAAGAADTLDIREVIYSPDGRVVKRWDRLGKRSTGDDSHRTHTHISYFADAEARDKVSPFRRFFEGDDMSWDERLALPVEHFAELQGQQSEQARFLLAWVAARVLRQEVQMSELRSDVRGLVAPEPVPVDIAALVAALRPELDAAAERAVRRVLGTLDNPVVP